MNKLLIAQDLSLPIDIVTEKLAFLGRTGSGKTYTAMKLAELMLEAGAQIIAMDPVGVWYGIRIGSNWNIYIFGGLHGDFPLTPTSGALMADVIVDRGICAVIDVSQFIRSEQIRFATDFIVRFYERKKAAPSAVHLFIEECQEFIPQNTMGEEAKMLHSFERAWKIGRNFGIGGSLISQRPQEINKKALNQAGTLFTLQMTGPQERKAIEGWVADKGIAEDIGALLPKLQVGQPHVWSPTFLNVSKTVRILPKISADVSTTPKVGSRTQERPLTPIDLENLKASMTATIEKAKAEDPKELRKQIAQLQGKIRELEAHPMKFLDTAAFDRERTQWLDEKRALESRVVHLQNVIQRVHEDSDITKWTNFEPVRKVSPPHRIPPPVHKPPIPVPRRTDPVHKLWPATHNSSELGKCERAILQVLSQYAEGCEAGKLALLAGYRFSGGFRNSLAALRTAGFLEGSNSGQMRITESGLSQGPFEPLPMGEERLNYWTSHPSFGACERRVLSELIKIYPHGLDANSLARHTGYEFSGGFRNALSALRTAGVIVGRNTETLRASETLFES